MAICWRCEADTIPEFDGGEVPCSACGAINYPPTATQWIEREARACYTKCAPCHPTWEDLGDTTKNVWRDRVVFDGMRAAPDLEDLFR